MFRLLILILFLKALIMALLIASWPINLGPEEAQYWTWSQQLDWGYYSKPPGIAWEIWFGTQLFGSTEFGVRFGAIVLSFFIPLSVWHLARSCRLDEKVAFWAALIIALCPLGILSSFLATTDAGFVLFWTLACAGLVRHEKPNYLLVGLWVGLGAFFKWPIYLFWVLALIYRRTSGILIGFFISLIGLIPSLIWNAQRGWPTFIHVWSTMTGGHQSQAAIGNFWEFFGAQAALISPLLFPALLLAWVWGVRKSEPLSFLAITSLAIFLIYQTLAYFQKMQGNWAVFFYPLAAVVLAAYLVEKVKWYIPVSLGLSLALVTILFLLPFISFYPLKRHPLKECVGWDQMGKCLKEAGYNPNKHVLVSDTYQVASELSFYSPGQKRAYFLNLGNRRQNQFFFWPSLKKEANGFFIWVGTTDAKQSLEKKYYDLLSKHFSSVKSRGFFSLFKDGEKEMLIFKYSRVKNI